MAVNKIVCVGVIEVIGSGGQNCPSAKPFVWVSEMSQPLEEIPGR